MRAAWTGAQLGIEVIRQGTRQGEPHAERHDYLTSWRTTAEALQARICAHWGSEKPLHWEDHSSIPTRPAAAVMGLVRNLAITLFRRTGHPAIGRKRPIQQQPRPVVTDGRVYLWIEGINPRFGAGVAITAGIMEILHDSAPAPRSDSQGSTSTPNDLGSDSLGGETIEIPNAVAIGPPPDDFNVDGVLQQLGDFSVEFSVDMVLSDLPVGFDSSTGAGLPGIPGGDGENGGVSTHSVEGGRIAWQVLVLLC